MQPEKSYDCPPSPHRFRVDTIRSFIDKRKAAIATGDAISGAPLWPVPQPRSKRSRFITFVQAATKSRTNFSPASALA